MGVPVTSLPSHPGELAPLLFGFLRRMDGEATTRFRTSGRPVGLSDYGWHARPGLKRPQNEVEWSNRLAQLLTANGFPVTREREYPGQSHVSGRRKIRCDLVVKLTGERTLWVEVKGAWRTYWGGGHVTYRSYLFHPLVPGLIAKCHTVPLDM